jgi:hypothetical protein
MSEFRPSASDECEPVVNFRPVLPGIPGSNLYRSSAPESAAIKIDCDEKEMNEAEKFILKEVDLILDLRGSKEGGASLKEKLIEKAPGGTFEEIVNETPDNFEVGKRYMMRLDFLGNYGGMMSYIDSNWMAPNELDGLDEKAVFQKRRSSFNSRGLAGMNIVLLERQDSMFSTLQLVTKYLEQVPAGRVLIHCTAGKDRTGMTCMLLQFVAGFSDEDMCREYTMSEAEASHIMAKVVKNHKESLLDPAIMGGADMAGIEGALSHLRTTYGSIESYLDEIGFDASWRDRLKKVLLGVE